MLGGLGYHVIPDPFNNATYWTGVVSAINTQRPGTVDAVHLQAYAGGAGNNPCAGWSFGAVPVFAGLWDQNDTPAQVQSILTGWHNQCGVTGGFLWLYDDFDGTALVAQYAAAINNAVGGTTSTLYDQSFGIVGDGTTFSGGIDGVGSAYSSALLGTSLVWNGVSFTFGPANGADVISAAGQTIDLTAGHPSSVSLLGLAINGQQTTATRCTTWTKRCSRRSIRRSSRCSLMRSTRRARSTEAAACAHVQGDQAAPGAGRAVPHRRALVRASPRRRRQLGERSAMMG